MHPLSTRWPKSAAVLAVLALGACAPDQTVSSTPEVLDFASAARTNASFAGVTLSGEVSLKVGTSTKLSVRTSSRSRGSIKWQSSNPGAATVNSQGNVTGQAVGTAYVTASGFAVNETYLVSVTPAYTLTSFTVSPSTGTALAPGQTRQFSTQQLWSDGQTRNFGVTYTASGGSISSSGLFTAGSVAGSFMVIANCLCGALDTAFVTVELPAQLTKITVSPKTVSLNAGATQQFGATANWSTGATTLPPITWSATGGSISTSGVYTAPATPGNYLVIVAHSSGSLRDTASVTVTAPSTGGTGSWQLAAGQYVTAKMPLLTVYPRPDAETQTSARHRRAYPGIQYRIPVAVQGGAYPFRFDLVSGPSGMSVGSTISDQNYGIVTWTPSAVGGPYNVVVRVTDQQGATTNASYTVTATTQGFVFMDPTAPAGGTGSIASPLRDFGELLRGSRNDRTFAGQILYLRGGTHQLTGLAENNGNINFAADNKPLAWLAYPGENVVLDASRAVVNFTESGSGNDFFAQGFTMRNSRPDVADSRFFFFGDNAGHRSTFFELRFQNLVRGTSGGDNPGAIVMFRGGGFRNYLAVLNSRIDGYAAPMVGSIYYTRGAVIEGNTLGAAGGTPPNSGIYAKSGNDLWSIRRNTSVQQNFPYGAVQFSFESYATSRAEISYNTLRSPNASEIALVYNWNETSAPGTKIWINRNTLIGRVRALTYVSFEAFLEKNLIFNDDAGGWSGVGTLQGQGSENVVSSSSQTSTMLSSSYLLRDGSRAMYFGTHGAEIPPSR